VPRSYKWPHSFKFPLLNFCKNLSSLSWVLHISAFSFSLMWSSEYCLAKSTHYGAHQQRNFLQPPATSYVQILSWAACYLTSSIHAHPLMWQKQCDTHTK
jgi:hypothetical protein